MMHLSEQIQEHLSQLSKSQKKVASFVLEQPREVAMASAQEIGSIIGVSETTVIRFCYSIGLSGYGELQKMIREQLLFRESSLSTYQQSKKEFGEEPHFHEKVMSQDRQRILETMRQIKDDDFKRAITQLAEATTIYTLGLRSSHAAAMWLSYTIGLAKEDVRLLRTDSEDIVQTISRMNKHSVLVVISFHRYLKETVQIAKLAKQQGVFIIGITDSYAAPIQPYSHILFPMYSPDRSTLDTTASLFSFMNAMVAAIVLRQEQSIAKQQQLYRKVQSDFLFVERGE